MPWKLVHHSVVEAEKRVTEVEYAVFRDKITELRKQVEYWQGRADAERIRADRQLDSLLQQNGIAPVSETVNAEIRERKKTTADQVEEQRKYLEEMFAETIQDAEPAEPVEAEDGN